MVDCIVCIDDVDRIKDCLLFVLHRITRTSALRFATSGRWGRNMARELGAVDARFRVFSFLPDSLGEPTPWFIPSDATTNL